MERPCYSPMSILGKKDKYTCTDTGSALIFDFEDDCKATECIEAINRVLEGRRFNSLSSENEKTYFQTIRTEKNGNEKISHYMGYKHLELTYETNPEDDFVFQLSTCAFPAGSPVTGDLFRECWLGEHPDRIMRMYQTICWESGELLIAILHHQKKN